MKTAKDILRKYISKIRKVMLVKHLLPIENNGNKINRIMTVELR